MAPEGATDDVVGGGDVGQEEDRRAGGCWGRSAGAKQVLHNLPAITGQVVTVLLEEVPPRSKEQSESVPLLHGGSDLLLEPSHFLDP